MNVDSLQLVQSRYLVNIKYINELRNKFGNWGVAISLSLASGEEFLM